MSKENLILFYIKFLGTVWCCINSTLEANRFSSEYSHILGTIKERIFKSKPCACISHWHTEPPTHCNCLSLSIKAAHKSRFFLLEIPHSENQTRIVKQVRNRISTNSFTIFTIDMLFLKRLKAFKIKRMMKLQKWPLCSYAKTATKRHSPA